MTALGIGITNLAAGDVFTKSTTGYKVDPDGQDITISWLALMPVGLGHGNQPFGAFPYGGTYSPKFLSYEIEITLFDSVSDTVGKVVRRVSVRTESFVYREQDNADDASLMGLPFQSRVKFTVTPITTIGRGAAASTETEEGTDVGFPRVSYPKTFHRPIRVHYRHGDAVQFTVKRSPLTSGAGSGANLIEVLDDADTPLWFMRATGIMSAVSAQAQDDRPTHEIYEYDNAQTSPVMRFRKTGGQTFLTIDNKGRVSIFNTEDSIGLSISQSAASPTEDFAQFNDNSFTTIARITAAGHVYTPHLDITVTDVAERAILITGVASQTADYFRINTSTSVSLLKLDAGGNLHWGNYGGATELSRLGAEGELYVTGWSGSLGALGYSAIFINNFTALTGRVVHLAWTGAMDQEGHTFASYFAANPSYALRAMSGAIEFAFEDPHGHYQEAAVQVGANFTRHDLATIVEELGFALASETKYWDDAPHAAMTWDAASGITVTKTSSNFITTIDIPNSHTGVVCWRHFILKPWVDNVDGSNAFYIDIWFELSATPGSTLTFDFRIQWSEYDPGDANYGTLNTTNSSQNLTTAMVANTPQKISILCSGQMTPDEAVRIGILRTGGTYTGTLSIYQIGIRSGVLST